MKKYILGFISAIILFSVYAFHAESRINEIQQKLFIGSAYIKDTLTSDLAMSRNVYLKDSLEFNGVGNFAIRSGAGGMVMRYVLGSGEIRFGSADVIVNPTYSFSCGDFLNSGNGSNTGNFTVGKRLHTAKGTDIASAQPITLGDGNYFVITGTTNIENIVTTDWNSGDVIILKFAGVLNMVHQGATTSGKLWNQSGANITTATNTTLVYVLDGSTWYQI